MRFRENVVPTVQTVAGESYIYYSFTGKIGEQDRLVPAYVEQRPYVTSDQCFDELHPGPPYQSGGPLDVRHLSDGGLGIENRGCYQNNQYFYDGGFICNVKPSSLFDMDEDWGDISSYGAEGWNKFRPAQPAAELSVFLAEIADIPKTLRTTADAFRHSWRSATSGRNAKKAADNWLNVNFGWLPFVADIRKFINLYHTFDQRLKRIIDYNGQWQRRGGVLRDKHEVGIITETLGTSHYPLLSSPFFTNPSVTGMTRIKPILTKKVWFRGSFRYYIPQCRIDGRWWRLDALAYLSGLYITPAGVWEAMPFSWLADYFANVGDVLANVDNGIIGNSLAAKYAYIMGTTTQSFEVTSTLDLKTGPVNATWLYEQTRKQRVVANPFGFSLGDDDLSVFQWSILAALGISKFSK